MCARHVKLQLSESLFSQISSESLGEVVDLLQSMKINLVTARKLLQEIISGNPESPSEVGQSTKNINIYIYLGGWWGWMGGELFIRACVSNAVHIAWSRKLHSQLTHCPLHPITEE